MVGGVSEFTATLELDGVEYRSSVSVDLRTVDSCILSDVIDRAEKRVFWAAREEMIRAGMGTGP
jgi:hypothetical protein